jgi:uncharacterized protein (TIGR00156 family)
MKKQMAVAAGMAALLTLPGLAAAQYAGPGAPVTVTTIVAAAAARDDTPVVLEGYLIQQVSKDKYIFSDGKDQIRVEIDSKVFPGVTVNERTRVRIHGEVEQEFMKSPEIDVERVEVL